MGIGRSAAQIQHVFVVVGAERGLVGRAVHRHGRQPMGIRLEVGAGPVVRVESRVKLLLQGAQIPAFGVARRPGPAQHRLPGCVRDDLLQTAVCMLDFQPEQEARFAQRPGAVASAVEQNGGTQDIRPRLQTISQIQRVGFGPAGVARGWPPLDALAIDFEPVTAVGANPARRAARLGGQLQFAPEEDEGVGQRAARGKPNPAGGREVRKPWPSNAWRGSRLDQFARGVGRISHSSLRQQQRAAAGGGGLEEVATIHAGN